MKVAVVGAAGKVGSAIAYSLIGKVDQLCLVDIVKDKVEGEALDIKHAMPSVEVFFGEKISDTPSCDVVIVPAGFPRTPDMKSRMDLVEKNAPILKGVVEQVATTSPKAILIIVSNPMDIMTYLAYKVSGFPSSRVIGMGGTLDSRRLRVVLSKYAGGPADAIAIGEHGEHAVPLLSQAKVNGKTISADFIAKNRERILSELIQAPREVILKKGGTWWAPAQATLDIVGAIVNKPAVLPCSVLHRNVCMGLPVRIGKSGVEKVEIPAMDSWERQKFEECFTYLDEPCRWVDKWLG